MILRTLFLIWIAACGIVSADDSGFTTADYEYFEKRIRPILVARCFECHSADAKTVHGGLLLDSSAGLKTGGDSGPVFEPGNPDESLLLSAIAYDTDGFQMPPKGKLPDAEIAELNAWIQRGAPFSADTGTVHSAAEIDFDAGREFWSFQPVRKQAVPSITPQSEHWIQSRADYFILAKLQAHGLSPSAAADRRTLLRRVSFDLTGLPPTPEELQTFESDTTPDAYEKQVDRLLMSPHYGERWGRFWLDLARYTDKTASWLYSTGDAYLYRDWVVDAMNKDMPYDEFVHRQLATDLMPETGPEDLPALGFVGLSPAYWKELKLPCEIIKVIVADEWEERVDAVSRTFLGLTVACARCHDHKFDPVSTEDYYALAGVFASSRLTARPIIDERLFEPVRNARTDVEKLETQLVALRKMKPKPDEQIAQIVEDIRQLKATPHFDTPMANGVSEESVHVLRAGATPQDGTKLDYRAEPRDLPVFIRGNPNRPGKTVPRRFLTVLSPEVPQPFRVGSGRLELAQAITRDAQALTSRVIVNRIWMAHFGAGLVSTPSNFGRQGELPSHPELLDDLSARFVEAGWSLKSLHRELVLSATYRQASRSDEHKEQIDPSNRFLWRMNSRRLDVESWRDAMLVTSGQLDFRIGGPSQDLEAAENKRRTMYGTIHRREMSTMLLTHDFPDPASHSPRRHATTTALQGLYVLNGPLLADQSAGLIERVERESSGDAVDRLRRLYALLFQREPSQIEAEIGLAFVNGQAPEDRSAKWKQFAHVLLGSNEFLYVD